MVLHEDLIDIVLFEDYFYQPCTYGHFSQFEFLHLWIALQADSSTQVFTYVPKVLLTGDVSNGSVVIEFVHASSIGI